jgi:hypothetical protein
VRASYCDETREQVEGLLKTLHYRKIGVIYPDDAFGEAVLQGVETALKANGASGNGFVCSAVKRDSASAIAKVRAANSDALVVVGPSNTVAPILRCHSRIGRSLPPRKANEKEVLADSGFRLIEGVVGRADQRTGLYVLEAHLFPQLLEFSELVGVNESDHRQMLARWLKVLAESKDVCALSGEILHGGKHLVLLLAKTKHHSCFRRDVGMGLFGPAQ